MSWTGRSFCAGDETGLPRSGSYSYAVMDACEGAFFNHDPPLPLLLHGSVPVLCIFIRSLLASKPGKQVARPPAPVRRQVLTMGENEIKWRPPNRKVESNKRGASRRWTEGCWGRKRWMEILSGVIWSILHLYMVQHFARSRIVRNLKTGLAAGRAGSVSSGLGSRYPPLQSDGERERKRISCTKTPVRRCGHHRRRPRPNSRAAVYFGPARWIGQLVCRRCRVPWPAYRGCSSPFREQEWWTDDSGRICVSIIPSLSSSQMCL